MNAQQSDQLDPCIKIPRISSPTKSMAYCKKISMVQFRIVFSGVDTINIISNSVFSKNSELLLMHEDTTIIGRNDIHILLQQKVTSKQISPKLVNSFIENEKIIVLQKN